MHSSDSGDESPLFVLASKLYVHYKFKARKSINPQAMLIDDDYAREVLAQVRQVKDVKLHEMAARFERARFGGVAPKAPQAKAKGKGKDSKVKDAVRQEPMLDFPLEDPA